MNDNGKGKGSYMKYTDLDRKVEEKVKEVIKDHQENHNEDEKSKNKEVAVSDEEDATKEQKNKRLNQMLPIEGMK